MANIGHWLVDYVYMIRGGVSMYLHTTPPEHYLGYIEENKVPVIIIPGILGKWGFYKNLMDIISHQGHPVYVIPELGHNLKNVPLSAKMVREIIEKNNIHHGVIISHSKGGIIGKYLLVHYNNDNRIIKMISVATPFYGSAIVKLIPHKVFRELSNDSEIIHILQGHTLVNNKIVSIYPEFDNHVWAKEKSFLPGAENIVIKEKGHHKILFNKELQNIIISQLDTISKTNISSISKKV